MGMLHQATLNECFSRAAGAFVGYHYTQVFDLKLRNSLFLSWGFKVHTLPSLSSIPLFKQPVAPWTVLYSWKRVFWVNPNRMNDMC